MMGHVRAVVGVGRTVANSPSLLLLTFGITMLSSTILYMIMESEDFINALYWSLVTGTTLGYGDFSPHTLGGKILTGGLISFTVFVMIPTITANVASWLIVNRDAFTDEEQEEIKEILRECQAILRVLHNAAGETPPQYMTNEELLEAAESTAEMN
jgi:voltage-gated potassium channel